MSQTPNPEPTESVKEPQPEPVPIPYSEPDIPRDDSTPTIQSQAEASGFKVGHYDFGRLEGKGVDYFNPGLVERPDGLWLLVRASEPHPQGFRFGQNSIYAFKTEQDGKSPTMGIKLRWLVDNPEQHFEDARGFYHTGSNQTFIGACSFLWYPDRTWTGAHQIFGSFDEEWRCKSVHYPEVGGNPGEMMKISDRNNYEKNWLWFMHDDSIMLLYKAKPWQMIRFNGAWSQRTEFKHDGVNWAYGDVRGGTTPVRVGDHYFTFHHSSLPWKGKYRRYYAGCLAFDAKPPFTPRMITPEPLLRGSQQDYWQQRKPLVVFPCGAVYKDDKWLVTCGVNDLKSAWMEMSHEYLLSKMELIHKVESPIFQKSGLSEAEILKEKRRANAAKARAALAAKRMAKVEEFHLPEDAQKMIDKHGTSGEIADGGGTWSVKIIKPKKRRRKRFKRITSEARQKALKEYESKKTLASE